MKPKEILQAAQELIADPNGREMLAHMLQCPKCAIGVRCPDGESICNMQEYQLLEQKNEWDSLTTVWASDKKPLKLSDGQHLSVMWPDKTISTEAVVHIRVTRESGYHGRPDPVDSLVPHLLCDMHGMNVHIPLHKLRVKRGP